MTTFTYAVTGTPVSPATTATSLSAKVAPLGWEKPFLATHKAAYRSKNPQSPQNLLLIDNSLKTPNYTTGWAKWANVGIVEDLSDIDTIVGAQAPYDPNNPTQNWKQVTASQWGWYKWFHARGPQYESNGDSGGGGRNWVLIGDDRLFFLFCTNAAGYGWYGRNSYCFGDLTSSASSRVTTTPRCWLPMTTTRGCATTGAIPASSAATGWSHPWTSRARCCCAITPSSATRFASAWRP